MYIAFILGLIVLAWISYHIWTILWKQGKYRVLPLLNFYVVATLSTLNTLNRALRGSIMLLDKPLVGLLSNQTLKFCLGINMTWVNLELILSFQNTLNFINHKPTSNKSRFIKYGRIITTIFICLFIVAALVIFSMIDNTLP